MEIRLGFFEFEALTFGLGQPFFQDSKKEWQSGGSTVTTEYVWSNGQVIMDLNGSNVVQERYLWGDTQDQLFARIDGNGTAWWYVTDAQGRCATC